MKRAMTIAVLCLAVSTEGFGLIHLILSGHVIMLLCCIRIRQTIAFVLLLLPLPVFVWSKSSFFILRGVLTLFKNA